MEKKKVFIFGAFNPVTKAHISLGLEAKKLYPDREILYVPTSTDYIRVEKGYTEDNILTDGERLYLLENSIGVHGFKVSNIEMNGIVNGKSYNTINYYGWNSPVICLGSDKLMGLLHWYRGLELIKNCHFLIVNRNRHWVPFPEELIPFSERFTLVEGNYPFISSSSIRDAYKAGEVESIEPYVPSVVYSYLRGRANVFV